MPSVLDVPTIETVTQRLQDDDRILFALLFGSRADGTARPDSDWDIAVYLDEDLDDRQRFDVRRRLSGDLEDLGHVDVIVLNDAPPFLGHQALKGQRLFVKDKSAWVQYFVRTIGQSLDLQYWRDFHREAQLQRLREGRFGRP